MTGTDGAFAIVAFGPQCGGCAGGGACQSCSVRTPEKAENPLGAQPGDRVLVTRSWRVRALKIALPVVIFIVASLVSDASGAKAGLAALISIAAAGVSIVVVKAECRRRGLGIEISEILEGQCSDTSAP